VQASFFLTHFFLWSLHQRTEAQRKKRWVKKSMESNFLMIMHEHLFVFRKPREGEKIKKFEESMA
jgi:hypothetical protein